MFKTALSIPFALAFLAFGAMFMPLLASADSGGYIISEPTFNYNVRNDNQYFNYRGDPAVTLRADDTNIGFLDNTILRWSSNNADYCRASGGTNGWSGTVNRSGSFNTGELSDTETYRITCTNNRGSDNDSVTIRVNDNNRNNRNNDAPDVTTGSATNIGTRSAILNAREDGNGLSTSAWFEYGPNDNYNFPYSTSRNSYGSGSSDFDQSISGLLPNTTYYYRAVAENREGANYGLTYYFTTATEFVVVPPPQVIYRPPTIITIPSPPPPPVPPTPAPTAIVLIDSSLKSNQAIGSAPDDVKPRAGDEVNYTVNYHDIGTGAVTGAILRIELPNEVSYLFANASNPIVSGQTLLFNLGSLQANTEGTVIVGARVRENIQAGINLNFPATLSYIDPAGSPQSVNTTASTQVWSEPVNTDKNASLGANVLGAGFLPMSFFEWLLLFVLVLILILLIKYLFGERRGKESDNTIYLP